MGGVFQGHQDVNQLLPEAGSTAEAESEASEPAARDATILFQSWEETAAWLADKHGDEATVSVFPCATMQLGAGRR